MIPLAAAIVLAAIGGSYQFWSRCTVEGRECTRLASAAWIELREKHPPVAAKPLSNTARVPGRATTVAPSLRHFTHG